MRSLNLLVPDQIDLNDYDLKMAMAVKLYETGKISVGQAAEIVGISKKAFIEVMGHYGSSLLAGYITADLVNDLANA